MIVLTEYRIEHKLHIISIRGTRQVDERIIEFIINQTILKLLNKVQHPVVKVLRFGPA